MNKITHELADEFIHQGLPYLDENQKSALSTHLSGCTACQEYANLQGRLASALSQELHNRWDRQCIPSGAPSQIASRLTSIARVRNAWKFAYAVVLLAVLILGSIEIFDRIQPPALQAGSNNQGTEIITGQSIQVVQNSLDPMICNDQAFPAPEGVNLSFPAKKVIGGGAVQSGNVTFQIYLYCDAALRPDDPQHFSEIAGMGVAAQWSYNGPEQEGQFQFLHGIEPAVALKTELDGLKNGDYGGYSGGLYFPDRSSPAWQVSELAKSGRTIQFSIQIGNGEVMDGASLSFSLQEGAGGYLPVDIAIMSKPRN